MRFFQLLALVWISLSLPLSAQSGSAPGDRYFDGFSAWKDGEKLEKEGNKQGALQKYLEAHKTIQSVAQSYPEWQPDVVTYRLKNVEQALARLGYAAPTAAGFTSPLPVPVLPPGTAPLPTPGLTGPLPVPAPATGQGAVSNPLDVINNQFKALQQQNAVKDAQLLEMSAKLKGYEAYYMEALKAQQKAEGDRDALVQRMGTLNAQLDKLVKESSARDAASQAEIQRLRQESTTVSDLLVARTREFGDTGKTIESLKKERDALLANTKRLEDELVKARSTPAVPVPEDVGKLMAENARLKMELDTARKQVQTLQSEGVKKDEEIASLKTQIQGIQAEITKLRQENTGYQTQVAELTVKLKEMNRDIQSPTDGKPDSQVVKENETLRQIIMRHLIQQQRLLTSKELVIAEMKKLEISSKSLIENLEDMTSGKIRITVDEESLFNDSELKMIIASKGGVNATLEATSTKAKSNTNSKSKSKSKSDGKKTEESAPELASAPTGPTTPAGPATISSGPATSITPEERLMVQADQAMQSQDFKSAEKTLQDVLRANPKNTTALISLAEIKRTEKKQTEAEVLLQKCLVYEPTNSSALYWLGVCQFQQKRLPDSLSTFEKCVQNDRKNARAHHYLGIISNTMSNRRRAEAEFKSALAIDPDYADAYFNLAVLYATSEPPDFDKAREHYRNALQRGVHTDQALEKLLNKAGVPSSPEAPAAPKTQEKTAAR